jgi:hypothetical protein
MISKINIKFVQDWSSLINKYQKFNQVWERNPSGVKFIKGYASRRYDFGDSGSLISFDPILAENSKATTANGKIIESQLPWVNKLKEDLSELNLAGITFQSNFGSLKPHSDPQEDPNNIFHCKLNYIIDDFDACTYVKDGDTVMSYPSVKDTAWLLDTTKVHWVECTGQRYIFQVSFHQKYSEVLKWFNSHPDLIYA